MATAESAAIALGRVVVQKALDALMRDSNLADERRKDLTELRPRTLGEWLRRTDPAGQVENLVRSVDAELEPLVRSEMPRLAPNERAAALWAVVETFRRADLSDRALFDVDLDASKLTHRLFTRLVQVKRAERLSPDGSAFYDRVLERSCDLYVRIVRQVPALVPRALIETLSRLTGLAHGQQDLKEELRLILRLLEERLPMDGGVRLDADAAIADRVQALVRDRGTVVAGRDAAYEKLDRYVSTQAEGPLVVRAPAGFGKTALLAGWTQRPPAEGRVVVSHFFAADRGLTSITEGFRLLLRQLGELAPALAAAEADPDRLPGLLYDALKRWSEHSENRLVVVLDALDEADALPGAPPFPVPLPANVSVLLSTRADDGSRAAVPALGVWARRGTYLDLAPLDREGLRDWLLATGDDRLAGLAADAGFVSRLAAATAGFPLFAHYLLQDLCDAADPQQALPAVPAGGSPPDFAKYVREQYVGLGRDRPDRAAQDLFALVVVAPAPVPQQIVQKRTGLTSVELQGLPWSVLRWLTVQQVDGSAVYAPAHPLLARDFRPRLGEQATEAQDFLVDYCARWREDDTGWTLRWSAAVLAGAGRSDELYALARDVAYRLAQMLADPRQPDLPLATLDAAITHAASERNAPVVGEFLLERAAHAEAVVRGRTPLAALQEGSLEEARRRAALSGAEFSALWTLLLAWELADTGQAEAVAELVADIPEAAPRQLTGRSARVAALCLEPLARSAPHIFARRRRQLLEGADDGIDGDAATALSGLAERLVDDGLDDAALATVRSMGAPRVDPIRVRIARRLAGCGDLDGARRAAGAVRSPRQRVRALAAAARGCVAAGRRVDGDELFRLAREAVAETGDRREWTLADLAEEQAGAGDFTKAGATAQEIGDVLPRSRALLTLVAEQVAAGADPADALTELRRCAESARADRVTLRLATACFRAGARDDARELFSEVLARSASPEDRQDVVDAQLDGEDLDGALQTLRSLEPAWRPQLLERLAVARAAGRGLGAGLELLQDLPIDGERRADVLVALAEHAAATGSASSARSLLAAALSSRPPVAPGADAAEVAIGDLVRTLAENDRLAEARQVLDLLPSGWARSEALPALATALVERGRNDVVAELAGFAEREWDRDRVREAIAAALAERGRHGEAMAEVARIGRIGAANVALVRMGRAAARHRRYDDAEECLAQLRSGSLVVDSERDRILAAVATARFEDSDLDAAGRSIEQMRTEEEVSACLAEMARRAATPAALDAVRGWTQDRLGPLGRLAPLAALVRAGGDRNGDAAALAVSAREVLATLSGAGGREGIPAHRASGWFAEVAADVAIELDRAGRGDLSRRVRSSAYRLPHGAQARRGIYAAYVRAGRRDVAQKALDAMDDDAERARAVRHAMTGAEGQLWGQLADLLIGFTLAAGRRSGVASSARALAAAGDWDRLTVLLRIGAGTLAEACSLCAALAAFSPADGVQLGHHLSSVLSQEGPYSEPPELALGLR
ncbi:NACHT N-terminal Helical domain 1-containing protein [Blastococcus deserti]|uniref:NACHT domain-containing protein n=1 Tax=Blastococcus deserti TaxID=2259033 RepID=A0ABW4XCG4_9ACTN